MKYREGQPPPVLAGRQPRGVRDFFAKKALARDSIIEKIRLVYELYGYEPLHTPAIERLDVLVRGRAGQEAQDSIYRVTNLDNESLGLRFDLTVPLARVIRQTPELRLPFRRYQVAPVWRRERPERGRYREFMQFDLDAVGVAGEVGDTEIIAAMCDVLHAVGAGPFVVRFSNRGILKALLAPGDGS
ncbi:MAG TPA: ATP phosphoribosyltransferase regulatory subunit, partial [Thermoanaerobaculia bacterium]